MLIQTTGHPGSSQATPQPAVSVKNVAMEFDEIVAVKDASFDLEQGRFLTILGPSGSGKTTLLRLIAGFLKPTRGEIYINGRPVSSVAPQKRSVGVVFQNLALFPHMTTAENVAFPLKMRRFDAKAISAKVLDYLSLVRLDGLENRRIAELSGGQKQRVAIARALVFEPDLLLLDEPLAALDRKLREELQLEFRRIQKELGVTTINVTHDQREALVVSDEIIVMDFGEIQQMATPRQMYRRPTSRFVASFLGVTNLLSGELISISSDTANFRNGTLVLAGTVRSNKAEMIPGSKVQGAIRAEQVRISSEPDALNGLDVTFVGSVADAIFEGERLLYEVSVPELGETPMRIFHHDQDGFVMFQPGEIVHIGWSNRDVHLFVANETAKQKP